LLDADSGKQLKKAWWKLRRVRRAHRNQYVESNTRFMVRTAQPVTDTRNWNAASIALIKAYLKLRHSCSPPKTLNLRAMNACSSGPSCISHQAA
jgi:hypothetical protein